VPEEAILGRPPAIRAESSNVGLTPMLREAMIGAPVRVAGPTSKAFPRMRLNSVLPVAALRNCVRSFQQREAKPGAATIIYPITARPDQILEFYFKERYIVHSYESGVRDLAPRAVIVGPCTHHGADLVLNGRFDVFTIQFQPAGFHQLFGVPMPEITDRAFDARSVLGRAVAELERKLADAADLDERTRIATEFLLGHAHRPTTIDAVAKVANEFLVEKGALRIADAAEHAGLSVRQFERVFCEQVGIPPKLYARIVRFHAALAAKQESADRRWTDVAYEFGYCDQMHMIRDFRDFSGENPTRFWGRLTSMPEDWI
jgi:AraC-like DNA-binding protein